MQLRHSLAMTAGVLMLTVACAQVPRASVELSATVGRDIAELHSAHRETARVLFANMREDVNRFVDDVYRPYIIQSQMDDQRNRATSSDQQVRNTSILLAISAAFNDDADKRLQESVILAMGVFVGRINDRVEETRRGLLQPILDQEADVINSLDRSYQQVHYANSIVTGHLASIAQVHDAQNEMLSAIGVERDLRSEIGESLSARSEEIGKIVRSARGVEDGFESVEASAQKLREAVEHLRGNRQ